MFLAAALLAGLIAPSAAHHTSHDGKQRPALAIAAAFSPAGELWVVGLDTHGHLNARTSRDDGQHWSEEQVLPTGHDTIAADGESRPHLAFGPDGRVAISYTQPLARPYTGEIRLLRSVDGGRSFSPPVTVHHDWQLPRNEGPLPSSLTPTGGGMGNAPSLGALSSHRFDAIAFDAKGTLHTLWIDKRDAQGRSDVRGAAIYRNESADGGASFGPDIRVAESTCECCRIALGQAPDGGLVAMWRHVFAPNERDHAFARIGTATAPVRATEDHWALDACPHHGPGLAAAAGGGWHAVWFGERAGVAGVRYGRLHANGAPDGEPRLLPDDAAEHADVMSAGPQVAIVWRSFDGEATKLRAWLSRDDGRTFVLKELGRSTAENDHPRLARKGDRLFAVWRTEQGVQVEPLLP
jgi:hypothetical protein